MWSSVAHTSYWCLLYNTGYGCLSTTGSDGSRKFMRGPNGRPKEDHRGAQHLDNLTSNYSDPQAKKRLATSDLDDAGTGSDDDDEQNTNLSTEQCIECSYAKPLRVIWQLSGFPTLITSFNKILVSLVVTSCSVERVMSRI